MSQKNLCTKLFATAGVALALAGCSEDEFRGKIDEAEIIYTESCIGHNKFSNMLRVRKGDQMTEFTSITPAAIDAPDYTNHYPYAIVLWEKKKIREEHYLSGIQRLGPLAEKTKEIFERGTKEYNFWRGKIREEKAKMHDHKKESPTSQE